MDTRKHLTQRRRDAGAERTGLQQVRAAGCQASYKELNVHGLDFPIKRQRLAETLFKRL